MMTLPPLSNWDDTAHGLHKVALLLGVLRVLAYDPAPNYLELAMKIRPDGLSTDVLPGGGEVVLDFAQAALIYRPVSGSRQVISLVNKSQSEVFAALLAAAEVSEFKSVLGGISGATLIERALNAARARAKYSLAKNEEYSDEAPLRIDPRVSAEYGRALYTVFTAVARFRAHLSGHMTPVVVWPEHFDLSTLWFHPENTAMDANNAHMNFGFAPFSPGLERPYLYAYAYPYPNDYMVPPLPEGANWHTEGWTGVIVPYDAIAGQHEAEAFIEGMCAGIFKALRPLIGLS
jgi:hypothetical protein